MELLWFITRIGTSISRTIPNDGTRDFFITDEKHARYLYENQTNKHTCHIVDFDFDLPEVKGKASAPRVQIVGDVCTNCEG